MKKKLILTILIAILILSVALLVSCDQETKIEVLQIIDFPKNEYVLGESLVFSGAGLLIKYQDGTDERILIDETMISNFDPNTPGKQFILVTYKGKSAGYMVSVNAPRVTFINAELSSENVDYIEDQNFNVAGAKVIINYENDTQREIPLTPSMVRGYDKTKVGSQLISIVYREEYLETFYKDWSMSVQIQVAPKKITKIEVVENPNKTKYFLGDADDKLLLDGGIIQFTYNNGYTKREEMLDNDGNLLEDLSFSWDTTEAKSESKVYLTYADTANITEFSTYFNVSVLNRNIEDYVFKAPPSSPESPGKDITLYQVRGGSFNFNGYSIEVSYNDDSKETFNLDANLDRVKIIGYDEERFDETENEIKIQIYYSELLLRKEIKIKVRVMEDDIEAIEVIVPEHKIYVDTEIDFQEWEFKYIYKSGFVRVETIDSWLEIRDLVSVYSQAGDYELEASLIGFEDMETTFHFTVYPMEIDSVELVNPDIVIVSYWNEDSINLDNLQVKVKYSNGRYKIGDNESEILLASSEAFEFIYDPKIAGLQLATLQFTDSYYNIVATVEVNLQILDKVANLQIVSDDHKTIYYVNENFDYSKLQIEFYYESNLNTLVSLSGPSITLQGFFFDIEGQEDLVFRESSDSTAIVFLKHPNSTQVAEIKVEVIKIPERFGEIVVRTENQGDVLNEKRLGSVTEGLQFLRENRFIQVKFEGVSSYVLVPLEKVYLNYDYTDISLGERLVTIKYPAGYDEPNQIIANNFVLTVNAKQIIGIEIAANTAPHTREYVYNPTGGIENFIFTGLEVIKQYNNGTNEQVPLSSSEFLFSKIDVAELGTAEVEISLQSKPNIKTFYEVEVVAQSIKKLSWLTEDNIGGHPVYWENNMPIAYLTAGQELDHKNLYSIRTTIDTPDGPQEYLARSFDELSVYIEYVSGDPETRRYSDIKEGITRVADFQKGDAQSSPQYPKLYYQGVPLQFIVHVRERELYEIELDEENRNKIVAIAGGDLQLNNVYLKVYYRAKGLASGEVGDESASQSTVVWFNEELQQKHVNFNATTNLNGYNKANTELGERTVGIYFEGKTTNFIVDVQNKKVIDIKISDKIKLSFVEGEPFSYSSPDNPNEYPALQVTYNNGEPPDVDYNLDELIQRGNLVIDRSAFDSSDFTGHVKLQTIKLIYTDSYDNSATFNYDVRIYDRRNVDLVFSISESKIYGEDMDLNVEVHGYDSVLNEDGIFVDGEDIQPTNTMTRGIANENDELGKSFYYVFFIPELEYMPNKEIFELLNGENFSEANLLSSLEYKYKKLRHWTKEPIDAGKYKVVLISFGDDVHNSFIYDSLKKPNQIKDYEIVPRSIYIKVAEKTKVYGENMPSYMCLELRDSIDREIPEDPLTVFAPKDREYAFASNGFISTNNQAETTIVRIVRRDGTIVEEIDGYIGFDILFGEKRRLEFNENAGIYVIRFTNDIVHNPNYALYYQTSSFTITKRPVQIVPEAGQQWIHDYKHPEVRFQDIISSEPGKGLLAGDFLYGNLVAALDLSRNIFNQLTPKKAGDSDSLAGYVDINLGVMNANPRNSNYAITLYKDENNPIYLEYMKRTLYVKLSAGVITYGQAWDTSALTYIFTKQVSGDTSDEDVFPLNTFNIRDSILDITGFKYEFYYIDKNDNETKIDTILPTTNVGIIKIVLELDDENQGELFNLYNINLLEGQLKIVPRTVTITPYYASKHYGMDDPVLEYDVSGEPDLLETGLMPGDEITGNLIRDLGEDIGEYNIFMSQNLEDNNPNYKLILGKNNRGGFPIFDILAKELFIDFKENTLEKEYDGKIGSLSVSDIKVYDSVLVGEAWEYEELDEFDAAANIDVIIVDNNKLVGNYAINCSSINPNYSVSFKGDAKEYIITKKIIEVDLLVNNLAMDGNINLEYLANGYTISLMPKEGEIQKVYDNYGVVETDQYGNTKYDEVTIAYDMRVAVTNIEVVGDKLVGVGVYEVIVEGITNSNYQLKTPGAVFLIEITPKILFLKLKDVDSEHVKSRVYDGKAISFSSNDYEIFDSASSLYFSLDLPDVVIGLLEAIEVPKDVIRDEESGEIISYLIAITTNSNNPNYTYRLFFDDYRVKITPKLVTLSIASNGLIKPYDGFAPSFIESALTFNGLVGTDKISIRENLEIEFTREINDGRSKSDVGKFNIRIKSLWNNYEVKLEQSYVYVISQVAEDLHVDSTEFYNPLEKEFSDIPNLPFFADTDFLFKGSTPKVKNFIGNDSKEDYQDKLSEITTSMNSIRSAFNAININSSTTVLAANIAIFKESINNLLMGDTIKYADNFPDIAVELASNLMHLKDNIHSLLEETNIALRAVIIDNLMWFLDNASASVDSETSYISFTFSEEDEQYFNTVGEPLYFDFESHVLNVNYIWHSSRDFVKIVERKIIIKIADCSIEYGTYGMDALAGDNGEVSEIVYEMYNLKGDLIDPSSLSLSGFPRIINPQLNVGYYDIDIGAMIAHDDNKDKYAISLSTATPNPRIEITRASVTVVMGSFGEDDKVTYVDGITISKIKSYSYLNLEEEDGLEMAIGYYDWGNVVKPTSETITPEQILMLKEYFGKVRYNDMIGSSEPANLAYDDELELILRLSGSGFQHMLEQGETLYPNVGLYEILQSESGKITAQNYNIRVISGLLKISRATATLSLSQGTVVRTYAAPFELEFQLLGLPGGEARNMELFELSPDGVLTSLEIYINDPNYYSNVLSLFLDEGENKTKPIVLNERTDVQKFEVPGLFLKNISSSGEEIVTRNFEFSFNTAGYIVDIQPKLLHVQIEKEGLSEFEAMYGTYDSPTQQGSNRNNYKIAYYGLADWNKASGETNLEFQPGNPYAPNVNLYGLAGEIINIDALRVTWDNEVLENQFKNYLLVTLPSKLTITKKEIEVGIDREKLKNAISFYSYMGETLVYSPMSIYPYISEKTYEIVNETNLNLLTYKIIGGHYGPADFAFLNGTSAAYGEKLMNIINKGSYQLPMYSPYFSKDLLTEVAVNKLNLLYNHQISIVKTAGGWTVTVYGLSTNNNYKISSNQVVYFTDSEVSYMYQPIAMVPKREMVLHDVDNYLNWKDSFDFYLLDTSVDITVLSDIIKNGMNPSILSEDYLYNLQTEINNQFITLSNSGELNSLNSYKHLYEVHLKPNFDMTSFYGNLPTLDGDFADYFTDSGKTATNERGSFLGGMFNKDFFLPLKFYKKTSELNDVGLDTFAANITNQLEFEDYLVSKLNGQILNEEFDKISYYLKLTKTEDMGKNARMALVLNHSQELIELMVGGVLKTFTRHDLFMIQFNGEPDGNLTENSAQDVMLLFISILENEFGVFEVYSYMISLSLDLAVGYDLFDGYYHMYEVFMDKSAMTLSLRIDNQISATASIFGMTKVSLEGLPIEDQIEPIKPSLIFNNPSFFGILYSGLEIDVKDAAYGNQGLHFAHKTKLVLSKSFLRFTDDMLIYKDSILNSEYLVSSEDYYLKYYLNGELWPEDAPNYLLETGLNKVEVYLFNNTHNLLDRLMTFIYYEESLSDNETAYGVEYDKGGAGSTVSIDTAAANSFYMHGDLTNTSDIGTVIRLKPKSVVKNLSAKFKFEESTIHPFELGDKKIVSFDFNRSVSPSTFDDFFQTLTYDEGGWCTLAMAENSKLIAYKQGANYIIAINLVVSLDDEEWILIYATAAGSYEVVESYGPFEGEILIANSPGWQTEKTSFLIPGVDDSNRDGVIHVEGDINFEWNGVLFGAGYTKFRMRLFSDSLGTQLTDSANGLLITQSGLYYEQHPTYVKTLLKAYKFKPGLEYTVSSYMLDDRIIILIHEGDSLVIKHQLMSAGLTFSNLFGVYLNTSDGLLKDVLFNYNSSYLYNSLIHYNGNEYMQGETVRVNSNDNENLTIYKPTLEGNLFEQGYIYIGFENLFADENSEIIVNVDSISNDNYKLTLKITKTGVSFKYKTPEGESDWLNNTLFGISDIFTELSWIQIHFFGAESSLTGIKSIGMRYETTQDGVMEVPALFDMPSSDEYDYNEANIYEAYLSFKDIELDITTFRFARHLRLLEGWTLSALPSM